MSNAIEWRWVEVDGEQTAVTLADLESLLATGALSEHTLVWRTGWSQWLHALNVAELSSALGQRAGPPVVARAQPPDAPPPPPPLSAYGPSPAPVRRPAGSSTAPPPPRITSSGPPPLPRTGPVPIRDVLPTLADEPLARDTLRPAGAIPPPPRALRFDARPPSFDDTDRSSEETAPSESVPPDMAAAPEIPAAPEAWPAARAPYGGLKRAEVLLATAAGVALPAVGAALLASSPEPPVPPPVPSASRHEAPPLARRSAEPRAAAVASAGVEPTPAGGCRLTAPARSFAARAYLGAPPLVEGIPGSSDVFVGFAESRTTAVGLKVDVAALEAREVFRRDTAQPIFGVVPLVAGEAPTFAVDHAGGPLTDARTVDGKPPFTIGRGARGFSRVQDGTEQTLWASTVPPPEITTPRVAAAPSAGYAVAFRQGGQTGRIIVGWLDAAGDRHGYPEAIQAAQDRVGTPTIAANDRTVLVGFAARPSPKVPWRIRLGTAPTSGLPSVTEAFSLPPGGPGGAAIAPAAAGLADGRFALQWTEGSAGNRAVRVQAIDSNLVHEGDPVTLSLPDQNAGQGTIWAAADSSALALFFVRTKDSYELWGAALKCE